MGWFDEQIKQRIQSDEDTFEDAFRQVAGSVLGGRAAARLQDERLVAREALDEILKYYHQKPANIPEDIEDMGQQLEYALRPLGMMSRDVELSEGWYRDAYGPMLGFLKGSGVAVALLPGALHGYTFRDPATGRRVKVNRRTEGLLDVDAVCFYQPLPMKKLGIPDLLLYMKKCISAGDVLLYVLATLAVMVVGLIEPRVYQAVTGPVLESRSTSMLVGMAVFLLCSAVASELIGAVSSLLMGRITTKTSLAVESSVMMRILSLPVSFFRRFSSGELSSRADSVGSLCDMLLSNLLSTGLTSALSLIYIGEIFRFAPLLVWPSILIMVVTVGAGLAVSLAQIGISRRRMKLAAQENGMSYAMVSGIQKIKLSGSEKRAFARWARLYAQGAELDYNPPAFIKLSGVITTAISLVGTVALYWLAVRSGVGPSQYYGFTAAYGRVMGAFSALSGIAISVASIPPILEMAEPLLKT